MANCIFKESFDNQSGSWSSADCEVPPALGSMTLYTTNLNEDIPAVYNTHYTWGTGRGGSGQCLQGAANKAVYIYWPIAANWPTDEMYISFWLKYPSYSGESWMNLKSLYVKQTDNVAHLVAAVGAAPGPPWYNITTGGGAIWSDCTNYFGSSNHLDGNWHHYEYWVKMASAGQLKIWYDGVLDTDISQSNSGWNQYIFNIFYRDIE